MRIVPSGCLLDHGRAHSIIPGTVAAGTFDDPVLPGAGRRVSFCEADPDGDGVPTMRDVCTYWPDPDQADTDGDGVGDECDPCPETPPASEWRPGHWDDDHDGLADGCDPCPADEDRSCETPETVEDEAEVEPVESPPPPPIATPRRADPVRRVRPVRPARPR